MKNKQKENRAAKDGQELRRTGTAAAGTGRETRKPDAIFKIIRKERITKKMHSSGGERLEVKKTKFRKGHPNFFECPCNRIGS